MPTYRDNAVVLRTHNLGEADRIVTLLTRSHGKTRAVGKGVRRTKSKFGSRLEPFMHVDLQCYLGKSLDVVTQVDTIDPFAAHIANNYELFTIGTSMLEAADRLVAEEGEPAPAQYWLLVGALRALAANAHQPVLVLNAYLLRAFALAGWAPSLTNCASCAEPGPHAVFSISLGGAVCGRCRPAGARLVGVETLELINALMVGDWSYADQASHFSQTKATELIGAFSQYHLERDLKAWHHVPRSA